MGATGTGRDGRNKRAAGPGRPADGMRAGRRRFRGRGKPACHSPVTAVTGPMVVYRRRPLVVGVGASRGAPAREVLDLVEHALADAGLSPLAVRHLATVDAKRDEIGIVSAARARGWPLLFHPAAALATVDVPNPSDVVRAAVGTPSVAEAASLLGADSLPAAGAALVVPKRASAHATVAVARHRPRDWLTIVGLGSTAGRGLDHSAMTPG